MTVTYTIFFFLIVCLFGCLSAVWIRYFSRRWPDASSVGHKLSWFIVFLILASRIVIFQRRVDPAALVNDGLSTQNIAQIGATLIGLLWALTLLLRRRVDLSDLIAGPGFWISLLIFLFGVSGLWSVWPAITVYRAAELGIFWVLAIHIFARSDWLKQIEIFLWLTISLGWMNGLLTGGNTFLEGNFHGAIRDNIGSGIAAAAVILVVFRITVEGFKRNWMKLLAAVLSLVVFGSFMSTAALICALTAFFAYRAFSSNRALATFLWGVTGVLFTFHVAEILFSGVSSLPSEGLIGLGTLFGKTPSLLENWTGRLPLWSALWDANRHELWGGGFFAAERLFVLNSPSFGWEARNAHNGYIAAWLGAGWIGFALVFCIFGAVLCRIRQIATPIRPLVCSLFVLLAINNLTTSSIGGGLNALFALMMGLACLSPSLAISNVNRSGLSQILYSKRSL